MYTASTALLEALQECGVGFLFCNFGSDHPAMIEAIAEARASGKSIPKVITCPNEMVALSAAHGAALATGQAQAVIVHVECGTQALAGALHNAAKGRAPVLIFAGRSPFTQGGELRGSRNEFIQWIQDVFDQHGIVRGYVKYDNELRTAKNVKQIVARALQFAHSDPKGPVYLSGAREVMEEETTPEKLDPADWRPIFPGALPEDGVAEIAAELLAARRPLLVTSFLGRNPEAVAETVALARRVGMGVLESVPSALNFPTDDPLYMGNQWNHPWQNPVLADADVVLLVDSDVPWIPSVSRPAATARMPYIDDKTIIVSESISNYHTVINHLRPSRPGSLFASGGGSLGWNGGAAIGVKLARPDATVVAMTGDGSFMFSVPSAVFWMARHYEAPFLTMIFNNRGWKSPKLSALAVHPNGYASRANDLDVAFDPPPDYAGIAAAAGGAHACSVRRPEDMQAAVAEAFRVVREERRCAVLDVWVPRL